MSRFDAENEPILADNEPILWPWLPRALRLRIAQFLPVSLQEASSAAKKYRKNGVKLVESHWRTP